MVEVSHTVHAGVVVRSILDTEDIVVSIALLGSTVVIVWLALVISRWRLTKPLGYVLLVFYAGFIAYTLLKPSACAV